MVRCLFDNFFLLNSGQNGSDHLVRGSGEVVHNAALPRGLWPLPIYAVAPDGIDRLPHECNGRFSSKRRLAGPALKNRMKPGTGRVINFRHESS